MLKISNLSYARGNQLILRGINLEIDHSEILLIRGPNGKGKTTLLSCISCFLEPQEGVIHYNNESLDNNLASKNFIYFGEENYAFENFSIMENTKYFLNLNNLDINNELILKNIFFLYGKIDINKKFSSLSFGQKRKFKILFLLLINKTVWLLDDPFNGLDEETIKKLTEIIDIKRNQNGIIIMASHQVPAIQNLKEFVLK